MRFRIVTVQVLMLLAAVPSWALSEAAKAGCAARVLLVWVVLVVVPLLLMSLAQRRLKNETAREWCLVLLALIGVAGYYAALPLSFRMIELASLRGIH